MIKNQNFLKKIRIPYSSFYIMRNNSWKHNNKDCGDDNNKTNSDKIDYIILETIKNYVSPPQYPLTLERIHQLVYDKIGVSVKKRKIKKFLKNSLKYSNKKWIIRIQIIKHKNISFHREFF